MLYEVITDSTAHDLVQVVWSHVASKPLPDVQSQFARAMARVDTEQVHATQNKGHDRSMQLGARRQPDRRDIAERHHCARKPSEDVTANVVDHATPRRFLERAFAYLQRLAIEYLAGADLS